jgi:gamma-glutamyltranspeptidase/glutathione hydrolase
VTIASRTAGGVRATRAMVASSPPMASEAGVAVLREGGTAADACVAMDAVLHVTEPTSTGLGGDAFALHYEGATGRVTSLNGSGRAPAALTADALRAAPPPSHGLWVTVPGCASGWAELARRHGTMPLSRLLAPAIGLAEKGFAVGEVTAAIWERGVTQLQSDELTIKGRAPAAGETFRNPGLARVLEAIAEGGASAFYEGAIASAIANAVQKAGGVMTTADLAAHEPTWDEPISATYRGARLWECPPNGQGLVALLALGVLEGFELGDPDDPRRWHLEIEALRLAFADARWWVSDPATDPAPLHELLSKEYASRRRALVNEERSTLDPERGSPTRRTGTVYHCAVDERGNACSMVSSHFIGFGTGVVPPGLGFVLHNRALGFSLEDGHPNSIAPGKRPYNTITPALLTTDGGALRGPLGVMGGFRQPQGQVQLVASLVDDGANPQEALDRPRFFLDAADARGIVKLERGASQFVIDGLRARGHEVEADIPSRGRAMFGRGQIILRDGAGGLVGGSDRRADGCALGIS